MTKNIVSSTPIGFPDIDDRRADWSSHNQCKLNIIAEARNSYVGNERGIAVTKKELLGLLIVFIVYVLLGGVVFMLLESPLEEQLREELVQLREDFQTQLHYLERANVTPADMKDLLLRLSAAHSSSLIDDDGNDTHTIWSFDNSFFFAITVVTTIGYGHLAPSTTPGRIFCLFYATVGIPLTGILLAAIGGHFSQHLVRRLQRARKSYKSRLSQVLSAVTFLMPWLLVFLVLPAALFTVTEGWTFVEGFYYCFITLSTIGFGDYVAGKSSGNYMWIYKIGVVLWIIFGLGYLAMILNYISQAMRCKQIRLVERRLSTSIHHTQQRVGQRIEEVYQILQEISRHRSLKPRDRVLKRMQSFPAPELRDRSHNHKIQRLLKLVQNLKEEEPAPRPRRFSLPLPEPIFVGGTGSRGSLQVETGIWRSGVTKNSCTNLHSEKVNMLQKAMRNAYSNSIQQLETCTEKQAVIDMEGLQCTRV